MLQWPRSRRTGTLGRLYELTGPRLLTFAQAIQEIAAATGRDISFQPISAQEYRVCPGGS